MKRLIGATVVALGVAATAAGAQEPVKHAANQVGHATAHAAKKTAKATEHVGNEVGHATAHAAKETAKATRDAANDAGHATAHAAKTIAGTEKPELMSAVRVQEPTARATVLRSYAGAQIQEVKLDKERGRVAWQYQFRSPGVKGKEKVFVDARTGQIF
jgi:uncharacterized membrane protein YkoI